MARVKIFQGGNIANQGTTDARYRAPDFGPSPLAEGLQALGKVGSDAAQKFDEIEDVRARVEANRLAIEHSELVRAKTRRVKESLGEGAEATALEVQGELQKADAEILGRASPRARLLLENDVRTSSGLAVDGWLDHSYRQKAEALETSSVARIERVIEDAADEDDEDKALTRLSQIAPINAKRGEFFGKGQEWQDQENSKVVSGFYKTRALKIAVREGESNGASAAIQYANKNRQHLSDADYNQIVNAYDNEALEDWAFARKHGFNPAIVGVVTKADPLAPLPAGAPPGTVAVSARADPAVIFDNLIIPNEGTSYVIDNNGFGAKYGANGQWFPGGNEAVKRLTRAGALQYFKANYFSKSGADKLPPGLAAIHADTYYLNPSQATKCLRESGGDPDRYMELRTEFLDSLHRKNPDKYPDYTSRNKRVEAFADQLGDGGALPTIDVTAVTSTESIRDQVFNTPGIGMRAKRAYFNALVEAKQGIRQEREERESETGRLLTQEVLSLGDDFTSLTQLPQNLITQASPSTLLSLTNAAASNKETRPLDPNTAATIGFLSAFKPQSFLDPEVQAGLLKKGVTPKQLATLAQQGGSAAGAVAGAKVDPIPRGELESIARPAFEAAGFRLWTTETLRGSKGRDAKVQAAEVLQDANAKLNLVNVLADTAQAWAVQNPGKRPDQQTMKQWVGNALLRTGGAPMATLDDRQFIGRAPVVVTNQIRRELLARGIKPTAAEIAKVYRRRVMSMGISR